MRERDLRSARDKAKGETGETEEEKEAKAQAMEEQLRAVDADFLNMIKEAEDDEATAAADEHRVSPAGEGCCQAYTRLLYAPAGGATPPLRQWPRSGGGGAAPTRHRRSSSTGEPRADVVLWQTVSATEERLAK